MGKGWNETRSRFINCNRDAGTNSAMARFSYAYEIELVDSNRTFEIDIIEPTHNYQTVLNIIKIYENAQTVENNKLL